MDDICPRGHNISVTGRYSTGRCRECERAFSRTYKANNRDKIRAYARLYSKAYRAVGPRKATDGYDDIVYTLLLKEVTK